MGAPGKAPTAVPIFALQSELYDPIVEKRPAAPFRSGCPYSESLFEKVFSLAQLVTLDQEDGTWAKFGGQLSATAAQLSQPKRQLGLPPGNLDKILSSVQNVDLRQLETVCLTHPHFRTQKRELCQVLFETFGVQRVLFAEQATCGLISTGNVTGTAVLAGHSASQIVCVRDGWWVAGSGFFDGQLQCGFGCNQLLKQKLMKQGIQVQHECLLNQCKHGDEFYLPDGQIVRGGAELAENLFNEPQKLGLVDRHGFQKLIDQTIALCNAEDRPKVSAVITVCGGMAQFVKHPAAKLIDKPEWAPWNGAGIVGTVAKPNAFLTKQLLAEKGDAVWGP